MPGLIFALALALRVWFIATGTVEDALQRTDAREYFTYAKNLSYFHTFSGAHPPEEPLVPDSFRDPGYPSFLAALLMPLGATETWYRAVLLTQAVLGALTAGLTVLVGRRWLSEWLAGGAGVMAALWPHNVVISGFVLSETIFGFMVMLAVWLGCRAFDSNSRMRWLGTGLAFGTAAMVNATITPFASLLALLLLTRRRAAPSLALALLCGSLVLPGLWAARSWSIDDDKSPGSRVMLNFVQGSWPEYHDAYIRALGHDATAQEIMRTIGDEQQLALRLPGAGLAVVGERLRKEPLRYLAWYAWKPALLWAWSIRMGWGDIYPYPVLHSVYLSNPAMRLVESLCFALNPLLFLLMAGAILQLLVRPVMTATNSGLQVIALLVLFETLVYSALQSEPRYSIPLRPLEMVLAAVALQSILQLRHKLSTTPSPGSVPDDEGSAGRPRSTWTKNTVQRGVI